MYSHKLAARAEAANTMARELAADVLGFIGLNTKLVGVLTTHCAPFKEARGAIANLSNAALRMWELACAARYEECEATGAELTPVSNEPSMQPMMAEGLIGTQDSEGDIG